MPELSPVGWILLVTLAIIFYWLFFATNEPIIRETPPDLTPESPAKIAEDTKTARKARSCEERCREILEQHYGKPFPKIRPNWLKNPHTGHNLELDCYNSELNIALEYNGEQHYVYPNYFHKTEEEFYQQLERDNIKENLCRRLGIHLIIVPYTVKPRMFERYIQRRLPTSES